MGEPPKKSNTQSATQISKPNSTTNLQPNQQTTTKLSPPNLGDASTRSSQDTFFTATETLPNKTTPEPEPEIEMNVSNNFKPLNNPSEKSIEFAQKMELDQVIKNLKSLAKKHRKHKTWINGFIDMATENKKYAINLSFKFSPIDKSTINHIRNKKRRSIKSNSKQDTMDMLRENLTEYENFLFIIRSNLTDLIDSLLFHQFNNHKAEELVNLNSPDAKEMDSKCKSEIKETKESIGVEITKCITQYKSHFDRPSPLCKQFTSYEDLLHYWSKLFYKFDNNVFHADFIKLYDALTILHDRQVKFMQSIEDDLKHS